MQQLQKIVLVHLGRTRLRHANILQRLHHQLLAVKLVRHNAILLCRQCAVVGLHHVQNVLHTKVGSQGLVFAHKANAHQPVPFAECHGWRWTQWFNAHNAAFHFRRGSKIVFPDFHHVCHLGVQLCIDTQTTVQRVASFCY